MIDFRKGGHVVVAVDVLFWREDYSPTSSMGVLPNLRNPISVLLLGKQ
ncbi:hypothetical protein [Mycobacterium leprae]|nr:hypothetical protein [Mycobacterium leprae]